MAGDSNNSLGGGGARKSRQKRTTENGRSTVTRKGQEGERGSEEGLRENGKSVVELSSSTALKSKKEKQRKKKKTVTLDRNEDGLEANSSTMVPKIETEIHKIIKGKSSKKKLLKRLGNSREEQDNQLLQNLMDEEEMNEMDRKLIERAKTCYEEADLIWEMAWAIISQRFYMGNAPALIISELRTTWLRIVQQQWMDDNFRKGAYLSDRGMKKDDPPLPLAFDLWSRGALTVLPDSKRESVLDPFLRDDFNFLALANKASPQLSHRDSDDVIETEIVEKNYEKRKSVRLAHNRRRGRYGSDFFNSLRDDSAEEFKNILMMISEQKELLIDEPPPSRASNTSEWLTEMDKFIGMSPRSTDECEGESLSSKSFDSLSFQSSFDSRSPRDSSIPAGHTDVFKKKGDSSKESASPLASDEAILKSVSSLASSDSSFSSLKFRDTMVFGRPSGFEGHRGLTKSMMHPHKGEGDNQKDEVPLTSPKNSDVVFEPCRGSSGSSCSVGSVHRIKKARPLNTASTSDIPTEAEDYEEFQSWFPDQCDVHTGSRIFRLKTETTQEALDKLYRLAELKGEDLVHLFDHRKVANRPTWDTQYSPEEEYEGEMEDDHRWPKASHKWRASREHRRETGGSFESLGEDPGSDEFLKSVDNSDTAIASTPSQRDFIHTHLLDEIKSDSLRDGLTVAFDEDWMEQMEAIAKAAHKKLMETDSQMMLRDVPSYMNLAGENSYADFGEYAGSEESKTNSSETEVSRCVDVLVLPPRPIYKKLHEIQNPRKLHASDHTLTAEGESDREVSETSSANSSNSFGPI